MEQSFHNMSLFFVKLHVWVMYVPNLAFTFHHIFLNDRYVILQTKRYSNWFWGFMSENILCSQKKLKSSQYTTCPHFIAFPWKAQHFGIAFFFVFFFSTIFPELWNLPGYQQFGKVENPPKTTRQDYSGHNYLSQNC